MLWKRVEKGQTEYVTLLILIMINGNNKERNYETYYKFPISCCVISVINYINAIK